MVENECDNEFNILDSEAEAGQVFGLQSIMKIPSPLSETNTMLESVEMTSIIIEAGSPNSRVAPDSEEKTSPKNSKNPSFYSSRKNSLSEQILSSRVEKFDSGLASGNTSN